MKVIKLKLKAVKPTSEVTALLKATLIIDQHLAVFLVIYLLYAFLIWLEDGKKKKNDFHFYKHIFSSELYIKTLD